MTSPNNPTGSKQQYGAYKVSEYTHDSEKRGYRVDETSGVPARQETKTQGGKDLEKMAADLEAQHGVSHEKRHKLGKDSEDYQ